MNLEVKGLCKAFHSRVVINNLNFRLGNERIHGFIGPNGAGKTTFFNLLSKLATIDAGTVLFEGTSIHHLKSHDLASLGLLRTFQISSVFQDFTVFENILLSLLSREKESLSFKGLSFFRRKHDEEIKGILEKSFLSAEKDKKVSELSYGKKRLLEIALSLAHKPKLLLLDEPFAGIGLGEMKRVSKLIHSLSLEMQLMLIEHNLTLVAELCDRVSVLHQGQILTQGTYTEVSKNLQVQEAYLGLGSSKDES